MSDEGRFQTEPEEGMSEPNKANDINNADIDKKEAEISDQYQEAMDGGSVLFSDGEAVDGVTVDKKAPRRVSLTSCLVSVICVALAAVMITYNCCINFLRQNTGDILAGDNSVPATQYTEFDVFKEVFESYSLYDIDQEQLVAIALKTYVDNTGDLYAEYYTQEEWDAVFEESEGKSEGIGINIIESEVVIDGASQKAFKVINVVKDSPSMGKLKVGDMIALVGNGDDVRSIEDLGYTVALSEMKGAAGTLAEFVIYRPTDDGEYERIEFAIERAPIIMSSVYYHVSALDPKVGVVKILQFDQTTPEQFCEAVDFLKVSGCDKFVFDVRYNPGGLLSSIVSVLSYFLEDGDAVIHTSDKSGSYQTLTVGVSEFVGEEDIGKYAGLNAVVLCNESTASAAELFTATFRDYDLGTIVGVKTYGKGSMQSYYHLGAYGISGGIKLTTKMYYPPCGEGYDGIGITPDVVVELDESLKDMNIYEINDEQDNQLRAALEYFK